MKCKMPTIIKALATVGTKKNLRTLSLAFMGDLTSFLQVKV